MGVVIRVLPRVVPSPPGKPKRPDAAGMQRLAREVADDPSRWDRELAAAMAANFDAAAAAWDDERASYRRPPLADALERGGPYPAGLAVELAAGTGVLTPLVAARWPRVLSVDLSAGMLARHRGPARVRADAARLPLGAGQAAVVVIGDGPFFAEEVARLLRPDGVVVWSNALGRGAPFHLPTQVLLESGRRATGRPWTAVVSEAHWGSWVVLRPDPA